MARKRKLPAGLWKRGDVYYARFSAGGRLVRKRLSSDYTVACQLLNDLKARADKGDFGILDLDYPWPDLKSKFMRWARQSIRNPEEYERDLRRFEEFTPVQNVREVTAERIDRYRSHRLDLGKTPRTVNREVSTVQNMLNKGVNRFKVIDHNPIADVRPLAHDHLAKERRPLAVEEVLAVFEHSPRHLKGVWRLYMSTGIRKSELVGLLFEDIDFEGKTMTVRRSTDKGHKTRIIPLDDILLAMLVELRDAAEDRQPVPGHTPLQTEQQRANFSREHVFVTTANTPLRHNLLRDFYAVCKAAGIADGIPGGSVDIHSLRVSFTTLSLEHGANPKAIQAILGHSTLAMTMGVYAKATDTAKRSAVGALPFTEVSDPKPRLRLVGNKDARSAQESAQVSKRSAKPLKSKGKTA